jgi:hypothetical protein
MSAAKERALPAWVTAGGGVWCGGAFERRLHVRALGGTRVLSQEADLFPASSDDPLAAAARVKALLRIARGERPLQRFAAALLDGHDEDTALALVGVADRAFLDAAAGTERARAASAIAADPALPALVAARAALARGDVEAAAASLGPVAEAPAGGNPWIAADAHLCRALVAAAKADAARARASIAAAPPSRIVRAMERRAVEAFVAPPEQRAEAMRALVADWPQIDAAGGVLPGLVAKPAVKQ